MEMVKKYGLWVLAGAIAVAAVVIYVLFVHTVAQQVSQKRGDIESRRDSLKSWASKGAQIPNPMKIQIARKNAEQVSAMLDQCEIYLARQPRWAHTIRFFMEGPFGPETEVPLDRPNDWLNLYHQYNQALQNQVYTAGLNYSLKTMDWGTSVPTPEGIGAAMEIYWFQKDLIDFLTQQVEKDFAAYLDFKAKGRADPFPAKPFDLVVNRSPARLDEFLRSISREKLVAVLGAIVVNRQQQDLATIFNTLLRDEKKPDGTVVSYGFPWERPASEKEHVSVRGVTMDEAQEKFLAEMLPPDKPDLSDRQRFQDYVMELRMVRYRADVIGLLESHHFDSLAAALRRGTEAEFNGILNDIADVNGVWNTTRIAEAISAIVSINNETDFALVRNNHAPNIAALISMSIGTGEEAGPTGRSAAGLGGRAFGMGGLGRQGLAAQPVAVAAPSGNGVYKLRSFQMQVKLRFERIPVFLRRLISNSWRYRVQILDISPTETTSATRGTTPGVTPQPRAGGGMPMRGGFLGMTRPTLPRTGFPTTRRGRQPEAQLVEAGNYVILTLVGEGYQFSPIMAKYRSKLENRATPAAPAPAGRSAAPTGAR
jgi:hypothetical protein